MHIACTRQASADTLALVRILLEHHANPNAVCNGQTPLSLAIACGNELLVNLLLDYERTDPSTPLGLGNGNALCSVLATIYEPRWPYAKRTELVGIQINENELLNFSFQIERLIGKNPKVLYPIRFGPKNAIGSAVDYAYYSFFAVSDIYDLFIDWNVMNFRIREFLKLPTIHYFLPIELFSKNAKSY